MADGETPAALRLATDIALRLVEGEDIRSEVILRGRPSGTVVSGSVLEAALHTGRGSLLFLTHDVPYEEMLSIHLLDDEGRLLDSATLGGPYTTGHFRELQLEAPDTASFRFFDEVLWRVRVLPKPCFKLPWWPDARGVWRGGRSRRYFVVERGRPGPHDR